MIETWKKKRRGNIYIYIFFKKIACLVKVDVKILRLRLYIVFHKKNTWLLF